MSLLRLFAKMPVAAGCWAGFAFGQESISVWGLVAVLFVAALVSEFILEFARDAE